MRVTTNSDETWYNAEETPARPWPWLWFLSLGIGFVILEVFADPAVVICCGCSKLGWSDVRTAWWLRRRDPVVPRGRTWCWFYLAHGFWKITVAALGMTLLLWLTADFAPRNWQISTATVLLCLAAFVLSSLATWRAVYLARRSRCRVWVNASIHASRDRDEFPPVITGRNRAGRVVTTAMIMIFLAGFTLYLVLAAVTFQALEHWLPLRPNEKEMVVGVLAVGSTFVLFIVLPVLLLVWRDIAGGALSAGSPEECWQETVVRNRNRPIEESEFGNSLGKGSASRY